MNPVKFALEDQSDALGHQSAAILVDGDGVLKVADAPGFCGERRSQQEHTRGHFVET